MNASRSRRRAELVRRNSRIGRARARDARRAALRGGVSVPNPVVNTMQGDLIAHGSIVSSVPSFAEAEGRREAFIPARRRGR